MSRITPGNRLYLYQLFSREVGVGRQTMLSRMEEVLAADDVMPCDLECADVRELLEALDDFVRLSVFKKGRVYATVLPRPDWDEILARLEADKVATDGAGAKSAGAKGGAASAKGGPKSWKRKRANKDPRPAKPRPHGRPVEKEPEIVEAEPAKGAQTAEGARQVAEAQPAETAEAKPTTTQPVVEEPTTAEPAVEATQPAAEAQATDTQQASGTAPSAEAPRTGVAEKPAQSVAPQADDTPQSDAVAPAQANTPPKAAEQPEPVEQPQPKSQETQGERPAPAQSGSKPTAPTPQNLSGISFTVLYDPGEEQEPEDEASTEPEHKADLADAPRASQPKPTMAAHTTAAAPESKPAAAATESAPSVSTAPTAAPTHAGAPTTQPEATTAPAPQPEPAVIAQPAPLPPTHRGLPQHFAAEVLCKDAQLSTLYQVLPFDVDPLTLLDEDWRTARATNAFEQHGSTVTFGLRYLREANGNPVAVTMRRAGRSATKRWELVAVGADDLVAQGIDMDGLPTVDPGPWADLVAKRNLGFSAPTPPRELTNFAHLGSWHDLLGTLAQLAAPEDWGDDLVVLREYLTLTFHRIMREHKLVTSDDDLRAVFDTGLLTPQAERIYLHFHAQVGDIPWAFDRFDTTTPEPVPEPAAYVTDLANIVLAPPYDVVVDRPLRQSYGPELDAAIERGVRMARRSYRVATPAYDPIANELRLLLPVALGQTDAGKATRKANHAVVLAQRPNGGYRSTALLPLNRAYACARVVTADLPSWL